LVCAILFPRAIPAKAVATVFTKTDFLISTPLLDERSQVLQRTKFDPIVTLDRRKLFLSRISEYLVAVDPAVQVSDCRNPKDNMLLELALSGAADLIVSGDSDLLTLHPWRGVAILRPADFLLQGL
jgi:putative PIN family toxin of toxin-antitoxin system